MHCYTITLDYFIHYTYIQAWKRPTPLPAENNQTGDGSTGQICTLMYVLLAPSTSRMFGAGIRKYLADNSFIIPTITLLYIRSSKLYTKAKIYWSRVLPLHKCYPTKEP